MSRELKRGDRVRVTVWEVGWSYRPGDKGTVLRGTSSAVTGERSYTAAMDKDSPDATAPTFAAQEIEPDL